MSELTDKVTEIVYFMQVQLMDNSKRIEILTNALCALAPEDDLRERINTARIQSLEQTLHSLPITEHSSPFLLQLQKHIENVKAEIASKPNNSSNDPSI